MPLPAKLERVLPARIDAILTKDEAVTLARHMNGNPVSHFLTVWTDPDGSPKNANSSKRSDEQTGLG